MKKITLHGKTIEECEILEKLYTKANYIFLSIIDTRIPKHRYDEGYWDISFVK